jgi:hypothetical protein
MRSGVASRGATRVEPRELLALVPIQGRELFVVRQATTDDRRLTTADDLTA